ncbi:MAG: AAA family ATPase [Panacagrimonas sp.]
MTGFQIVRLTLVGSGVPKAEVHFASGLNVIFGPSDTGKTYIVQCIDYMLGASKEPKSIPESERYESAQIAIRRAGSDDEIVLERSLRGGNFKLCERGKPDRTLSAKHQPGETNNVSQYLLDISGLKGKKVRTNKQGKTRVLSFRDIAQLILVDEETVISETSPVHSGQFTSSTVESAVFRLLLTGVDDASLVAVEDPKTSKGKREGRAEVLELLLERARSRLAESQPPGDPETWMDQLARVESLYSAAESVLASEQQSVADFENRRRSAWGELRRIESRTDVLTELQQRFGLLEQQYQSDLRRLDSIAEAGTRLGQMNEERCPVCGALAEHHGHEHQKPQAKPEDVAQACLAEAGKTRALLSDLDLTRSQNDSEIERLAGRGVEVRLQLKATVEALRDTLKPRIEIALQQFRANQSEREVYRRAVELRARVEELETLTGEASTLASGTSGGFPSAQIRADEADGFSKEVEALLRKWHFPNLDRVTFSEVDQDVVISGRKRASHGKGVRAIAHAAFNLALLSYDLKRSMPHPGMVLIDSPLVVYREPDTDEGGFSRDVKDAFYRAIAEEFRASQVIIFENEDPPAGLEQSINAIRFTGASHGRRGFIPSV